MLSFVFFVQTTMSQNINELTWQEKIGDFTFLIEILKYNYPYFDTYESKYGEPWLSKSDFFLNRILTSQNNKEYLVLIDSIVGSLHHKHVDLAPTYHWTLFRARYGEACLTNPIYTQWVNTLKKSQKEISFWNNLLPKSEINILKTKEKIAYKDSLIPELKTAILRIPSFDLDNLKEDSLKISKFLYLASNYNYIIIDIQGNKGGSSFYWREGIVNRLINYPLYFKRYFILKNGKHNHSFFSHERTTNWNLELLPSLPLSFQTDTFNVIEEATTFYPSLPIPFKGKIIILTDSTVFSAADEFAYFAQNTSWATIVGETTGGGGIGTDPVLVRLPFSGIIVRYPALAGLNADGSLHNGTNPDIEIKGRNSDERLDKLINMIKLLKYPAKYECLKIAD